MTHPRFLSRENVPKICRETRADPAKRGQDRSFSRSESPHGREPRRGVPCADRASPRVFSPSALFAARVGARGTATRSARDDPADARGRFQGRSGTKAGARVSGPPSRRKTRERRARARVAPASSADSEVPKPERPPSCRSAPGIDRARRPGRPSRSASLCHARQPSLRKARSG